MKTITGELKENRNNVQKILKRIKTKYNKIINNI